MVRRLDSTCLYLLVSPQGLQERMPATAQSGPSPASDDCFPMRDATPGIGLAVDPIAPKKPMHPIDSVVHVANCSSASQQHILIRNLGRQ
jgi:hypothetical protein